MKPLLDMMLADDLGGLPEFEPTEDFTLTVDAAEIVFESEDTETLNRMLAIDLDALPEFQPTEDFTPTMDAAEIAPEPGFILQGWDGSEPGGIDGPEDVFK